MSIPKEQLDGLQAQMDQLRRRWPQARYETTDNDSYRFLIVLPDFRLPKGWNHGVCTALFETRIYGANLGAPLNGFCVDVPLRLENGAFGKLSRPFAISDYKDFWHEPTQKMWSGREDIPGFSHWRDLTRFWWKQQMFDPNRETLFTSAMLVRERLRMVR